MAEPMGVLTTPIARLEGKRHSQPLCWRYTWIQMRGTPYRKGREWNLYAVQMMRRD